MDLVPSVEQIQYFQHNGRIEFEELLSSKNIDLLIAARKRNPPSGPFPGSDLRKEDDIAKKIIHSRSFFKIAGTLLNKSPLRLIFTMDGRSSFSLLTVLDREPLFLRQLLCGLCLCLQKPSPDPHLFFPDQPGNGIFFSDISAFLSSPLPASGQYFLLFYGNDKFRLSLTYNNPLLKHFETIGYENGQYLTGLHNPSYGELLP